MNSPDDKGVVFNLLSKPFSLSSLNVIATVIIIKIHTKAYKPGTITSNWDTPGFPIGSGMISLNPNPKKKSQYEGK